MNARGFIRTVLAIYMYGPRSSQSSTKVDCPQCTVLICPYDSTKDPRQCCLLHSKVTVGRTYPPITPPYGVDDSSGSDAVIPNEMHNCVDPVDTPAHGQKTDKAHPDGGPDGEAPPHRYEERKNQMEQWAKKTQHALKDDIKLIEFTKRVLESSEKSAYADARNVTAAAEQYQRRHVCDGPKVASTKRRDTDKNQDGEETDTPGDGARENKLTDTPGNGAREKELKDTPGYGAREKELTDTPGEDGAREKELTNTPGDGARENELTHTPGDGAREKELTDTPGEDDPPREELRTFNHERHEVYRRSLGSNIDAGLNKLASSAQTLAGSAMKSLASSGMVNWTSDGGAKMVGKTFQDAANASGWKDKTDYADRTVKGVTRLRESALVGSEIKQGVAYVGDKIRQTVDSETGRRLAKTVFGMLGGRREKVGESQMADDAIFKTSSIVGWLGQGLQNMSLKGKLAGKFSKQVLNSVGDGSQALAKSKDLKGVLSMTSGMGLVGSGMKIAVKSSLKDVIGNLTSGKLGTVGDNLKQLSDSQVVSNSMNVVGQLAKEGITSTGGYLKSVGRDPKTEVFNYLGRAVKEGIGTSGDIIRNVAESEKANDVVGFSESLTGRGVKMGGEALRSLTESNVPQRAVQAGVGMVKNAFGKAGNFFHKVKTKGIFKGVGMFASSYVSDAGDLLIETQDYGGGKNALEEQYFQDQNRREEPYVQDRSRREEPYVLDRSRREEPYVRDQSRKEVSHVLVQEVAKRSHSSETYPILEYGSQPTDNNEPHHPEKREVGEPTNWSDTLEGSSEGDNDAPADSTQKSYEQGGGTKDIGTTKLQPSKGQRNDVESLGVADDKESVIQDYNVFQSDVKHGAQQVLVAQVPKNNINEGYYAGQSENGDYVQISRQYTPDQQPQYNYAPPSKNVYGQYGLQGQNTNDQYGVQKQNTNIQYGVQGQNTNLQYEVSGQNINYQYGTQGQNLNGQYGVQGQNTNGQYGVQGQNTNGQYNVQVQNNNGQYGVQGQNTNGQYGVQGQNTNGQYGVQGQNTNGQYGVQGQNINVQYGVQGQNTNGQYGVQGQNINGQYGVQGQNTNGQYDVQGQNNNGQYDVQGQNNNGQYGGQGQNTNGQYGVQGQNTNGQYGVQGQHTNIQYGVQGQNTNYQYGVQGQNTYGKYGAQGQNTNGQFGVQGQNTNGQFGMQGQNTNGQYGVQGQNTNGKYDMQGQNTNGHYGAQGQNTNEQNGMQGQNTNGQFELQGQNSNIQYATPRQNYESGQLAGAQLYNLDVATGPVNAMEDRTEDTNTTEHNLNPAGSYFLKEIMRKTVSLPINMAKRTLKTGVVLLGPVAIRAVMKAATIVNSIGNIGNRMAPKGDIIARIDIPAKRHTKREKEAGTGTSRCLRYNPWALN